MKIKLGLIANVYQATVKTGVDRNTGKEFNYGNVVIEQDGSIAEVTCSAVIVPEIALMKENKFVCEFDTNADPKNRKVKIVGVVK